MAKRTALIDADIVAFKFASTAENKYAFGTAVDDLDEVTPQVDAYLQKLLGDTLSDELIICLSCPTEKNWRLNVLPSYKGNRDYSNRPQLLQSIKDYMERSYPSYRRDTLEADDIMGILSTHPTLVPGEKVIVSEDKDMKTIPGLLFNPRKHASVVRINPVRADANHLRQAITGDATDGYAGCPGAGPVEAEAVLAGKLWESYQHTFQSGLRKGQVETRWVSGTDVSGTTAWERIVALYARHGLTEADALVQARVARICRATDYDFKNKEVILWTPK